MSQERAYGSLETSDVADQTTPLLVIQRRWEHRRRHSYVGVATFFLCLFILVLLFFLLLIIWAWLSYSCGLGPLRAPIAAPKNWTDFSPQSFAVGFDLTAGYGTAAVMFENGTTVDVARAEGTPEYNELLARVSLLDWYPTPPYYSCTSEQKDYKRQWRRYFRKLAGKPASTDVATYAYILSDLKKQTDTFLKTQDLSPLELAFITVPNLRALYLQDLVDAGEYAHIQLLTLDKWKYRTGDSGQYPVTEINTAFGGNGFGLNELHPNTTSLPITASLIPQMETNSNRFLVLFTKTALTAHISNSGAAWFYASSGITNFTLGPPPDDDRDPYSSYWTSIRSALRAGMASYYRSENLAHVISYGESAHNEVFDAILKEEVLANQKRGDPESPPVFSSKDPVYAAARGAAELYMYCRRLESWYSCFPDLRPQMQGW